MTVNNQSLATELGRFGHHPDAAIDFCFEVEEIESVAQSWRLGLSGFGHEAEIARLDERIERALGFRVGGDASCVEAKAGLRIVAEARGFDLMSEEGYMGAPIPRCDPVRELGPLVYAVSLSSALSREQRP